MPNLDELNNNELDEALEFAMNTQKKKLEEKIIKAHTSVQQA